MVSSTRTVQSGHAAKAPNIVFILLDQLSFKYLSCYGNGHVATPHLQRLADQALVFDKMYCASPVCLPARASIATGLFSQALGAAGNYFELPTDVPVIPDYLRPLGYRTGVFGKLHWKPYEWEYSRYDEWVDEAHLISLMSRDNPYTRFVRDYLKEQGRDYRKVLPDFTRLLDPEGEYDAAVLSGVNPLPYSHSPSHFLAEKTIDFVKRRDERPFFAYLSPLEPHHPYFPTREFADLYTDRIGEIWDEKVIDDFPMKAAVQADFDYVRSRLDGAQFRDVLDRYLGLITEADASIGKVFSYLESAKLMDDTVIIVTADHGDMMGDFGLLFKDRMYEASARVPFLFYHPQFQRAGRIERVASHVDLLPTFLELAGGAVPPHLPGKSLLPFLSDPAHVNHRAVFSFGQRLEASEQLKIERVTKLREAKKELMADRAQMPARAMVRTESHKAIYAGVGGAWDSVELYDLDRDPDELTDLAGQPGQAATLAEMGALLKDWEDDVRLEAERLKAMRRDEKALP